MIRQRTVGNIVKSKEKLTLSGKICDLHAHTSFSDGSLTPTELVDLAIDSGLSAIALTDHNTIRGCEELVEAASGRDILAIPGIEFSTDYEGTELHIIALGVKPEVYPEINAIMDEVRERKRLAMDKLVLDLIEAGYQVDAERIHDGVKGIINRAHVATELVRCGYAESRADAFDRILYSGGPFYKEPKYSPAGEIVDFIRKIGAVSILAHPFLNLKTEERVRTFLDTVRGRLDGIEVYYSEYTDEQTRISKALAEEYGLYVSGGSDYHGKNKPEISLGVGYGNLVIPYELIEKMNLV